MVKRLGVLTSGGDCAGLNATIRSIVLHATSAYGIEVVGIRNGTTGLITRPVDYQILTPAICDTVVLRAGGTILGSTNKADPFNFPNPDGTRTDRSADLIQGYHDLGLDALIGIGGDGSMRILRDLAKLGDMNIVTIPKTIDNDLAHTELAVGYSTALGIATEALDRLQPTAASHHRVMVLEVMGRDAGHIALGAGIAGGADAILIPEIPYTIADICMKIRSLQNEGRHYSLVIAAEAVPKEDGYVATLDGIINDKPRYGGIGQYISDRIGAELNVESRATVLGHVQRGAAPNALDRLVGSAFGVRAVDLAVSKQFNRMVAWQHRNVIDIPIDKAISYYQSVPLDDVLVRTAKGLGIYIGNIV